MLASAGCASVDPQEPTSGSVCDQLPVQTETDHEIRGNVRVDNRTPLADVHITVEGAGFSAETCSDREGKWHIFAPSPSAFTVIVDWATLPDGVTHSPSDIDTVTVSAETITYEVEWGMLDDSRVVNFFFQQR